MDPRVRRAHYYLGMVAVLDEGVTPARGGDRGVPRRSWRSTPRIRLANLRLGMALVEAQQPAEALPLLELAARADPPHAGRLPLPRALPARARPAGRGGRPARGARWSWRGRAWTTAARGQHPLPARPRLARGSGAPRRRPPTSRRRSASRPSARRAPRERSRATWPAVARGRRAGARLAAVLRPAARAAWRPRRAPELHASGARVALARAYLNLGVLQAQAERFARAAELFEQAAGLDPEFPQVQYSLGVAYFNAQRFDKAAPRSPAPSPQTPGDAGADAHAGHGLAQRRGLRARPRRCSRDDPERDATRRCSSPTAWPSCAAAGRRRRRRSSRGCSRGTANRPS